MIRRWPNSDEPSNEVVIDGVDHTLVILREWTFGASVTV
jgi:hypothetical protein